MTETQNPGRRSPPAWMVAPAQQQPAPVPPAAIPIAPAVLAVAAAVLTVTPAPVELLPVPVTKADPVQRSRSSGVEHDLGQARPWNLPDWK